MNGLVLMAIVLQLVIPVLLIVWIALGTKRSRVLVSFDVAITAAYIYAIAIAGLWLVLPHWLPWAYVIALIAASATALVLQTQRQRAGVIGAAARVILLVAAVGVAGYGVAGRSVPTEAMHLEFPLPSGKYIVGNGGANILLNAHYMTLRSEQMRAYRGQSYGVDILGVGSWGTRRNSFNPRDPRRYSIFGTTVIAPCAGEVITALDGHADMPVPERDREHLEGNHVILECDGVWIVLAHLRRGSVRRQAGDIVRPGDVLGEVGNSGNSDEPHLHVHVQTAGTVAAPLSGDPIPVRFGSRRLARNSVIASRQGTHVR